MINYFLRYLAMFYPDLYKRMFDVKKSVTMSLSIIICMVILPAPCYCVIYFIDVKFWSLWFNFYWTLFFKSGSVPINYHRYHLFCLFDVSGYVIFTNTVIIPSVLVFGSFYYSTFRHAYKSKNAVKKNDNNKFSLCQ